MKRPLQLSRQTVVQLTPESAENVVAGRPPWLATYTETDYGCHSQIACTVTCVTYCWSCGPGC